MTSEAQGQSSGMETVAPVSRLSIGTLMRRPETGSFIGMVFVFAFFALLGGRGFLTPGGAASWLNVAAYLGIVAIPIGMIMIAGYLDISIGAIIPASSITVAIVSGHYGAPIIVGIVAALAVGLIVGFINGLLVVRTVVPSLIVTLGTLFAVQGLTLGLSVYLAGSTSAPLVNDVTGPVVEALLGQKVGGQFHMAIFWWIGAIIVTGYIMHYSRFGNWVFALGGDQVSARNAGIPTDTLTIALFMASGFAAAFAGIAQAILYNTAQVSGGMSFIFNSIISVVIGGVILTGGYGSVFGIVLGTMTFAIVNQGIYYTGINANWSALIIGFLLLIAVLMNNTFRNMALAYAPRKKGKAKS